MTEIQARNPDTLKISQRDSSFSMDLAPGMLTISKMAHASPQSRVINEHESFISLMMSDGFRMHWNNNLGKAGKVLKMLKEARARSFA